MQPVTKTLSISYIWTVPLFCLLRDGHFILQIFLLLRFYSAHKKSEAAALPHFFVFYSSPAFNFASTSCKLLHSAV